MVPQSHDGRDADGAAAVSDGINGMVSVRVCGHNAGTAGGVVAWEDEH